jgi:ribosomal protein S18 acetylase RimI-like enzyme
MTGLRESLREEDALAVERLVTLTGVFSAEEIVIARSLIEETRAGAPGADYRFLFADGETGLEGYTCYGPIPGTDRRYELYWIAVNPDGARRGLGRALLAATEAQVRALGGTHLFAETSTRADYAPARAFYTASGYTLHAEVPDFHADSDGLAIYGKRL